MAKLTAWVSVRGHDKSSWARDCLANFFVHQKLWMECEKDILYKRFLKNVGRLFSYIFSLYCGLCALFIVLLFFVFCFGRAKTRDHTILGPGRASFTVSSTWHNHRGALRSGLQHSQMTGLNTYPALGKLSADNSKYRGWRQVPLRTTPVLRQIPTLVIADQSPSPRELEIIVICFFLKKRIFSGWIIQ